MSWALRHCPAKTAAAVCQSSRQYVFKRLLAVPVKLLLRPGRVPADEGPLIELTVVFSHIEPLLQRLRERVFGLGEAV
ncbi:MAG TPA: hypothetical protein VN937_22655 [Blastocatellia bacterium]|nr:hypothetical protein [Blastocatellia bacterium]